MCQSNTKALHVFTPSLPLKTFLLTPSLQFCSNVNKDISLLHIPSSLTNSSNLLGTSVLKSKYKVKTKPKKYFLPLLSFHVSKDCSNVYYKVFDLPCPHIKFKSQVLIKSWEARPTAFTASQLHICGKNSYNALPMLFYTVCFSKMLFSLAVSPKQNHF